MSLLSVIGNRQQYLYLLLTLCLVGCASHKNYAPVVDFNWKSQSLRAGAHRVQSGETLYSIAFKYDRDYTQLAAFNHISYPYIVKVGQIIRVPGYPNARFQRRNSRIYRQSQTIIRQNIVNKGSRQNPTIPKLDWSWPARGRVATSFLPLKGKKGIDIAGRKGDVVKAASSGVVAYAGSGLSGYGNLIIIKHRGQYLTAYGNNLKNRVKEGQKVKAGQIIADMGIVERKFWGVHFEIRKSGQPMNPLVYLNRHL